MGCDNNAADDMLFLKVVSIDALDYDELDRATHFFLDNVRG
jgi:hypothetical protein